MEPDRVSDRSHGVVVPGQRLAGGPDAVAQQVFAVRDVEGRMEGAAELETAEPAMAGDGTGRELVGVVTGDKRDRQTGIAGCVGQRRFRRKRTA